MDVRIPGGVREWWARARIAAELAQTRGNSQRPSQLWPEGTDFGAPDLPVNCIVFSRNRAMQLDACLRSIHRWAPYSGPIVVVYQATATQYANGYRLLNLEGNVRLEPQATDFRRSVLDALDAESEYTVFHTDDDVFFRRPEAAPVLPAQFASFSLRLGENTTYCYPLSRPQRLPVRSVKGPIMTWDWMRARGDFAFPMSLDGHIFSTRLLLRMLSRARFSNPNKLEGELHLRRYLAPQMMLAFRKSCLVSIPANVVTATHRNRAGQNPAWSAEALNARFLAGDRIDLESMDFSNIRAAHQEVPLIFKSINE
jgi:hypothetical protein